MNKTLLEFPTTFSMMDRRTFLKVLAAATALSACGDSDDDDSDAGTTVTGQIDAALLFAGLQVGSSRGPSTVNGNTFTTTISGDGVGILTLEDGTGRVRGFTLTFPGEVPGFSPEASALAILFLEPGIGTVNVTVASERVRRIRSLPSFVAFSAYLREHAEVPLDHLSGEADFITARDTVVQALDSQLPDQEAIAVSRDGSRVVLSNPSLRFLRVTRRDDSGDHVLDELLPPYGTLTDRLPSGSGQVTYFAGGAGSPTEVPTDLVPIADTYGPTLFFSLTLPILELAGGNPVSVENGLQIHESLGPLPTTEFAAALESGSSTEVESAVASSNTISLGGLAESITSNFESIAKLVTAGSYIAGLAFSIGAIMKFKQHKDNPTQIPIGTPIALVFIAAALLFLPSILSIAGATLVGSNGGSLSGERFEG